MLNYLNAEVIKLVYSACNAYKCGSDEDATLMKSILDGLYEILERVGE